MREYISYSGVRYLDQTAWSVSFLLLLFYCFFDNSGCCSRGRISKTKPISQRTIRHKRSAAFAIICGLIRLKKTVVYDGHAQSRVPVSNGLSDRISKDLKKRGFKYIGTVTIYSHLQACGMVNDHDEECPCFHQINASHPCIHLPPDQEAQLMTLSNMPER